MPRNGAGVYLLPPGNPVVTQTLITSAWANSTMADLAAAITQSLARDGQTVPTANLPMGGFRHVGVGEPALRDQYTTLGMVQDNSYNTLGAVGGVNAITSTLIGGAVTFVSGQTVRLVPSSNNTGPVTLQINGGAVEDILSSSGSPLSPNNLQAGQTYTLVWNGANWILGSADGSGVGGQAPVSGWERPISGVYPDLTVSGVNLVGVPAGSGKIVAPSAVDISGYIDVSWPAQDILITGLANWGTVIAVDVDGNVVQLPPNYDPSTSRNYIILGGAIHISGAVTAVQNSPSIYADVSYMTRDLGSIFRNTLISGGRLSRGVGLLNVEVADGRIWRTGGDRNDITNPNFIDFAAIDPVLFYRVTGNSAVLLPQTSTVPVAQYDPGGLGVLVNLPGATGTAIHRLYYVDGSFIFVYGQSSYPNLNDALLNLYYDDSTFILPAKLQNSTFLGHIVAQENAVDLGNTAVARIISAGNTSYSLGSPGALDEAPVNGQSYGRNNAAWALVAPLASPVFTGDPRAPTPPTADNDTSLATTAFVKIQDYLQKAGGTMTGTLVGTDINLSGDLVVGNNIFATGNIEANGRMRSVQLFEATGGGGAVLGGVGGTFLRPNGVASVVGQAFINALGDLTVTASGIFGGILRSDQGSVRAQNFGGDPTSGILYLGNSAVDSYIWRPGSSDQFIFKYGDAPGESATLNSPGLIWTNGNLNPASYVLKSGDTMTGALNIIHGGGPGLRVRGAVTTNPASNLDIGQNPTGTPPDDDAFIYNRVGALWFGTANVKRGEVRADGMLDWTGNIETDGSLRTAQGVQATGANLNLGGNGAFVTVRPNGAANPANESFFDVNGDFQTRDIRVIRPSAPTNGVIFFGDQSAGSRYLFWDGTRYEMPGARLDVQTLNAVGRVIQGVTGGQGFEFAWNNVDPGQGRNEYINNRGGGAGGHVWYGQVTEGSGVTLLMRLDNAGNLSATNFIATSDARLKDQITYEPARDRLADLLKFCTWIWSATDEVGMGLIAQDVQEVAPEYVYTNEGGTLGIDKASLALECVIGLAARVAELESKK